MLCTLLVVGFHIRYTSPPEFVLYPTIMHGTPLSFNFGVIFPFVFTMPASPQVLKCSENPGFFPSLWTYLVAFLSFLSMTVSPSKRVAVLILSLNTLYRISVGTCAWYIIARDLPINVANPTSTRLFLWGVAAPVYSIFKFNCHSFEFALVSSAIFSPALSHRRFSTGTPACFHLWNFSHVGFTIPFLVSKKSVYFIPVLSSTINLQFGLVTLIFRSFGALIVEISKYTRSCILVAFSCVLDFLTLFCCAFATPHATQGFSFPLHKFIPISFAVARVASSPMCPVIWCASPTEIFAGFLLLFADTKAFSPFGPLLLKYPQYNRPFSEFKIISNFTCLLPFVKINASLFPCMIQPALVLFVTLKRLYFAVGTTFTSWRTRSSSSIPSELTLVTGRLPIIVEAMLLPLASTSWS